MEAKSKEDHLIIARIYFDEKDMYEAKSKLLICILKNRDYIDAHKLLTKIYRQEGKFSAAKASLGRLIEFNQYDKEALDDLGNIEDELQDHGKALACFEKVLEIDREYISAYNNKAIALKKLGDWPNAISTLLCAIDIDKTKPVNSQCKQLHYNIAILYMNQKFFSKAKECFTEAIALDPNYTVALINRSNVNVKLGHIGEAIDDLDAVFECADEKQKADITINKDLILRQFSIGPEVSYKPKRERWLKNMSLDPLHMITPKICLELLIAVQMHRQPSLSGWKESPSLKGESKKTLYRGKFYLRNNQQQLIVTHYIKPKYNNKMKKMNREERLNYLEAMFFRPAKLFVDVIKKQFPHYEYVHTGHLFGGTIAEAIAFSFGDQAINFDSAGARILCRELGIINDSEVKKENIINYINRDYGENSFDILMGDVLRLETFIRSETKVIDVDVSKPWSISSHEKEDASIDYPLDGFLTSLNDTTGFPNLDPVDQSRNYISKIKLSRFSLLAQDFFRNYSEVEDSDTLYSFNKEIMREIKISHSYIYINVPYITAEEFRIYIEETIKGKHQQTSPNRELFVEDRYESEVEFSLKSDEPHLPLDEDSNLDEDGNTELHRAVEEINLENVKVLLKKGADVNALNHRGKTPLHLLTKKTYRTRQITGKKDNIFKIAELFIEYGANLILFDDKGNMAIDSLLKRENRWKFSPDLAQYLLENRNTLSLSQLDALVTVCCNSYNGSFSKKEQDKKMLDEAILQLTGKIDEKYPAALMMRYRITYWGHLSSIKGIYSKLSFGIENESFEGISPQIFLALRARILLELIVRVKTGMLEDYPLSQEEMFNKFLQELLYVINMLHNSIDRSRAIMNFDKKSSEYTLKEEIVKGHISQIVKQIMNLSERSSIEYAGGWLGHSVYITFERSKEHFLTVIIYNLGQGYNIHERKEVGCKHQKEITRLKKQEGKSKGKEEATTSKLKKALPYGVRFEFKKELIIDFVEKMVIASFEDAETAKTKLYKHDRKKVKIVPRNELEKSYPWKREQTASNCTFKNAQFSLQVRWQSGPPNEKESHQFYHFFCEQEMKIIAVKSSEAIKSNSNGKMNKSSTSLLPRIGIFSPKRDIDVENHQTQNSGQSAKPSYNDHHGRNFYMRSDV